MEKDYLILKRASVSRPSGAWYDDDYDVLTDGIVVGRIFNAAAFARGHAVDVDVALWLSQGPLPDAWLRGDARSGDGGVRQALATAIAPPRPRRGRCRDSATRRLPNIGAPH